MVLSTMVELSNATMEMSSTMMAVRAPVLLSIVEMEFKTISLKSAMMVML